MTPRIDVVELPDRVKLPYAEQGDSSGVPVLLLHGYTVSWRPSRACCRICPRPFALSPRRSGAMATRIAR